MTSTNSQKLNASLRWELWAELFKDSQHKLSCGSLLVKDTDSFVISIVEYRIREHLPDEGICSKFETPNIPN